MRVYYSYLDSKTGKRSENFIDNVDAGCSWATIRKAIKERWMIVGYAGGSDIKIEYIEKSFNEE